MAVDRLKVLVGEINGQELEYNEEANLDADNVFFDNSGTEFTADNVQDALEEIKNLDFVGIAEFESFYEDTLATTTSNDWVTYLQEETEAKSAGNFIILHTIEVGQSDKEKQVGHRVQWRLNATGSWTTLVDIRDAVSRDNTYQLRTSFNQISVTEGSTIEIRIQFGQTDDGGTARVQFAGFTTWKVVNE